MSISRLNAHSALLPLLAMLLSRACAAAPVPEADPIKLTPADASKARQVALPALKSSVEEPADRVPVR